MRRLLSATAALLVLAAVPGCGCGGGEAPRARRPQSAPADLDPAREAYRAGLRHYGKAKPGSKIERRSLSAATKSFRRCLDLLEDLRKKHPSDARIERLDHDASRYLNACRKRRTI